MRYELNVKKYKIQILKILQEISKKKFFNYKLLRQILQKYPRDGNLLFSKDQLIAGYKYLLDKGHIKKNTILESRIKIKPSRTLSGVVPITVLTKPFFCPGSCIFCPSERGLPKSYLSHEPGAQRAFMNKFDPYLQTYNRLFALQNTGHNIEKVELIVLGGTWSYYPKYYQVWFIKELFRALNDFYSKHHTLRTKRQTQEPKNSIRLDLLWEQLLSEHKKNESAKNRSVGLSIETRPDFINKKEIIHLRKLGCTKIQIGIQSMNDEVLKLNYRSHDVNTSLKATNLLRQAGFKIQIHYMPNLYGSTPKIDIQGYRKLFKKESILPDEVKLYPCSLIKGTKLYDIFTNGKYKPYPKKTLLSVISECMLATPEYTRLSRVVRDIPSHYIVKGNKKTNFRQIVENNLIQKGTPCQCIRCREIKGKKFDLENLKLKFTKYSSKTSTEYFLQYVTKENRIVGFLRLSIPFEKQNCFISELKGCAIIREIHIYGISLNIDETGKGSPQHLGLGTKLIRKAKKIAKVEGYKKLAVISAIGTREYYRKKGFRDGKLYQYINI